MLRKWLWGVGVAAMLLGALPAYGKIYYVAPDGTPEGDGTREKPFSMSHVLKAVQLQPGDEVVFLDGVYNIGKTGPLAISSVGTVKAPVIYRAENRHKAILDGGTPLTGWRRVPGEAPIWECRVAQEPQSLLVNGDGLVNAGSEWHRRDGKKTLEEGMFGAVKEEKDFLVQIYPWAGQEPREVYALANQLVQVGGAFNVVDGFICRRAVHGIHLSGRAVHTYKIEPGIYFDLCGMNHNVFGSFNIVRHCIVRDTPGQGMTSNESRFNLIEDCIIYNAGQGQGCHGIYISQGAENLTLRRNIWWRTSGGAIHIYSGSGTDSPRGIVVEYNIFGPDKRNRCFPIKNRKSAALYVWGGQRWAGHNRIVHNLIIGPHDRAISLNRCNFNLIANNTFLNSDGAPIQVGSGFGNIIVNNIIEYAPGGQEAGAQEHPAGYCWFAFDPTHAKSLSIFSRNLLLPRGDQGRDLPPYAGDSIVSTADPFVNRAVLDLRLKPGSVAVDMGLPIPFVTDNAKDNKPDAGALELGEEIYGEKGKFPEIPPWLLTEWPISRRGQ